VGPWGALKRIVEDKYLLGHAAPFPGRRTGGCKRQAHGSIGWPLLYEIGYFGKMS